MACGPTGRVAILVCCEFVIRQANLSLLINEEFDRRQDTDRTIIFFDAADAQLAAQRHVLLDNQFIVKLETQAEGGLDLIFV